MWDSNEPIPLPPIPDQYLVDWFREIGRTMAGGMGEAPLTWQEIAAWEGRTGIELEPWESRTVRAMSEAYLIMRHDAKKSGCPAPWSDDAPQTVKARLDSQFERMWKGL